jgi:hypothetical protein
MLSSIRIAFWSYLAPLGGARPVRLAAIGAAALLAGILGGVAVGWIPRSAVSDLRGFLLVPGLAVATALFSELPLRDGITHRTLLYPLLGPVSRPLLAGVRVLATALLIAIGVSGLVAALGAVWGRPGWISPREVAAIFLGSLAYTTLFNFVHLLTRRGLVVSLAIYVLHDGFIGRLPFTIRDTAPSRHMRVLAGLDNPFSLPIPIGSSDPSPLASALILAVIAAGFLVAGSVHFSRKNLAELC